MYVKKIGIVIFCLALAFGCKAGGGDASPETGADDLIPDAGDEDYTVIDYAPVFKMWEEFQAPFTDADKNRQDDSEMCWAAAAANIITWAGWSADEDDVFETLKAQFQNQPGYIYEAILLYFSQHIQAVHADSVTIRETRSHLTMDFIVSKLHEGKGVVIFTQSHGNANKHYLTVFGYRYYSETDSFLLYFTDSDDHWHQMRNTKLDWNDDTDKWMSPSLGWYLEYAISLERY